MTQQINPDTVVKLSLTVAQAEVVRAGLLELPGKHMLPVLGELDRQVNAQLTALASAYAQAEAAKAPPPAIASES